ncbi:cysteine--tRNA ligase [Candidatus Peregrinibacteria bacterium]|jgi:cysteinyl-tRNA synthetase|nr:cysteine--tRNA ligase [Candidatus Peregrinibacteria bacterium]
MQLHNTLTKKKEEFVPLHEGEVKMYLCGPTVYDRAHLGHGRSAVAFDLIRRYFIYKGFKVTFVSNYTDIDDKMINRAAEEGISVPELTEKIIPHYEEDYGALNILPSDISPRATEYIEEMIALVQDLLDKDIAYALEDGIYFDVSRDKDYGKLSGQRLEDLKAGARITEREDKRNHQDFALWKFEKPGEPSWNAEFGKGRPGWHIECSAMSTALLGNTFDIHAGGLDLIFPHHECEIAQSESSTGEQYVKYWLHNGFVQIDNEKMSKSLGNFFTLRDIFQKYPASTVRLFLISTHYRSPINFSDAQLEQAAKTLQRLNDFVFNLKTYENQTENNLEIKKLLENAKNTFETAMDNDFEVPEALAVIFSLIKDINRLIAEKGMSTQDAMKTLHLIRAFNEVLGIIQEPEAEELINVEIEELIRNRETARAEKNYTLADSLRDQLTAKGIELIDTPDGVKWRRK